MSIKQIHCKTKEQDSVQSHPPPQPQPQCVCRAKNSGLHRDNSVVKEAIVLQILWKKDKESKSTPLF